MMAIIGWGFDVKIQAKRTKEATTQFWSEWKGGSPYSMDNCSYIVIDEDRKMVGRARTITSEKGLVTVMVYLQGKKGVFTCGKGTASGEGYCKISTAFERALQSAGFSIQGAVAGQGVVTATDAFVKCSEVGSGKTNLVLLSV